VSPRRYWFAAVALVALACVGVGAAVAEPANARRFPAAGVTELGFTPGDRIDRMIIAAIDAAQQEILVLAYSFTDRSIARSLVRAHARGVRVAVVADREQARALPQNVLGDLVSGGVDVRLDGNFQNAHNKVVVIDADTAHATTITGSYNFTLAAQRSNAENVIVLRDNPPVARAYRDNWMRLRANAVPWTREGT
jgi:phosphatidylserine/phosphatidylglycerophosphate/cardiolipin synthase-like enzyme